MIIESPSSSDNDYHRSVNHELSVDLDSTDAFEGPEKLLEVWFSSDPRNLPASMPRNGLRCIARNHWEDMLDIVQCKVLSVISTHDMDAYLLSESSMFVFPHKVILKTCGTTTTLIGIPFLLDIVSREAGYPRDLHPWRVFYSRKSFMFPERQEHPHNNWKEEVAYLDSVFKNGSAYMVGNLSSDHWYLYTTSPGSFRSSEHGLPMGGLHEHISSKNFEDETLEVLMTELCPTRAAQFFTSRLPGECVDDSSSLDSSVSSLSDPGHDLGALVTKNTGIDTLYPTKHQVIDSFGFTPCGYSCNAIINGSNYFTIHVTPEEHCSYASFETNVPAKSFGQTNLAVLEKVINIFRPGKFAMTLFEAHNDTVYSKSRKIKDLDGYKRTDRILYELDGYDLVFMSFEALKPLK